MARRAPPPASPGYPEPMPVTRRALLRGGLALPFASAFALNACGPSPAEEALARGARALWGLQAPDGLFPSREFGLLGRGQSLTPFALLALAGVPERLLPFPKDAAARGLQSLLALMGPQGAIGLADPVPDYPVYATALTVSALAVLDPAALTGPAAPLVTYLTGQQLSAGWEGSPGHGAFPMGGRDRPRPPQPGHVDLSMTRRAIEALKAAGQPVDPAALGFVLRCGAPDGGFVYSPVEPTLNKSAEQDGVYEGYGSATCDGLLALLALGRGPDDARVQAALTRLKANHRADLNPNVAVEREMFARAMRFYYRAGAAQVFKRLGGPPGWQEGLISALIAEQGEDGLWRNELALQKESEPIIASSFALLALSAALGV
jgi:hypothetical protein